MGDRIAVMNKGRVMQVGAPIELYERPANSFVAGFIGSPRMNLLSVHDLLAGVDNADGHLPQGADERTVLGVRPEHVLIGKGDTDALAIGNARVDRIKREFLSVEIDDLVVDHTVAPRNHVVETIAAVGFDPGAAGRAGPIGGEHGKVFARNQTTAAGGKDKPRFHRDNSADTTVGGFIGGINSRAEEPAARVAGPTPEALVDVTEKGGTSR